MLDGSPPELTNARHDDTEWPKSSAPVTLEEAESSYILQTLLQTHGVVGGPNVLGPERLVAAHQSFTSFASSKLSRRFRSGVPTWPEKRKPEGTPGFAVRIIPAEQAGFISWLNAIYHVGRDWDFITRESIFVPEACGKEMNRIA